MYQQETVELLMLKSRASPTESRDDEVAPLCWRCRRHAPPLCAVQCPHCKHVLAHSLATHGNIKNYILDSMDGVVV